MNNQIRSLGGKAKSDKIRKEYNLNPNICLECGKKILVTENDKKLSDIKIKKFCNRSCSITYNNKHKIKIVKIKKIRILKLLFKSKGELFENRENWQSARSSIQINARKFYLNSDKPRKCFICGYDKHFEVCHIKSVSMISDETLISEINSIDNLIALCPNHHWEFDNGYINL